LEAVPNELGQNLINCGPTRSEAGLGRRNKIPGL